MLCLWLLKDALGKGNRVIRGRGHTWTKVIKLVEFKVMQIMFNIINRDEATKESQART